MRTLDDYELGEQVAQRKGGATYRARQRGSLESVVISVISVDPSQASLTLSRCRREYEVGRTIQHESVVRYLDLRSVSDEVVLIQEDFGGLALEQVVPQHGLDVRPFLELAVQLADALAALHDRGIIHAAVCPQSILVNLRTKTAKLAALGSAFRFRHDSPTRGTEPEYDGYAYRAPEQSGRMASVVDYRADLYSLGATFYRMLSGVAPFWAEDALALTHSHTARVQEPLERRRPWIPFTLARIVDRLLAKDPRARYQSAHGLSADLARCLRELDETGHVPRFALGHHDVPARIEFSRRLYGRDEERGRLLVAFAEVSQGASTIVWVKGEAGSGKSALVRTLARPTARRGGRFLTGKVEQARADEPYAGLSSAIADWVQQLLTDRAEVLADWRRKLTVSLGANLYLLLEAFPALQAVVGEQARSAEQRVAGSALETSTRLHFAFRKLLEVLAQPEHPLVLFLDDLQWASAASIQLLQGVFVGASVPHLLLIGGYRSEEVDAKEPLGRMLVALSEAGVASATIELAKLLPANVAELLTDTLHTDRAVVFEFAQVVWEKCSGNPLALRTFIEELEAEGLLRPSSPSGRWAWDLDAVRALPSSANTLGSQQRKLQRLPEPTRDALWVASCVGSAITVPVLSALLEKTPEQTWSLLLPAIRDGLVILSTAADLVGDGLRSPASYPVLGFSHDQVQRACAALPVVGDLRALHERIGRQLLETSSREQCEERIFAIVEHLNLGMAPGADTEESQRLAELNLMAGQRARATAAYAEGLGYFERAISLLTLPAAWSTAHELVFELHVGLAECAGILGKYARARSVFEVARAQLRGLTEQLTLLHAWVAVESRASSFDAVLALVQKALSELGVELPVLDKTAADSLMRDWGPTERTLAEHTVEELVAWPEATDAKAKAELELLALAIPAAYFVNRPLMDWMALKSLQLSLERGFTKSSSFSFVAYALHLVVRLEDPTRAVRFGQIALRLAERFPATDRGRILYVYGVFLGHWTEPARQCAAYVRTALVQSLQMGDIFHARVAALMLPLMLSQTGQNMDTLSKVSADEMGMGPAPRNRLLEAFVRSLQGVNADPTRLDLADQTEEHLCDASSTVSKTALAVFQVFKLELLVLHGKWVDAVALVQRWDRIICKEVGAMLFGIEYACLSALAIVSLLRERPEMRDTELASLLASRRTRLGSWAALCPVNFEHEHLLLEAELSDLEGDRLRAAELYDAAIEAATRAGFTNERALANERAAAFYERRGRRTLAKGYWEDAHEAYLRWGATAKAKALLAAHPSVAKAARAARDDELDLISVFKASQAISRETRLYELVQRVLQICAENAGAERALLVLHADRVLRVVATWPPCGAPVDPVLGVPLGTGHDVSVGIVRYVLRTGESLLLDNAAEEGAFTDDPTVRSVNARSILAMPLSHADPESGVLYLENRLTPRAFMQRRLILLDLLVRQACISIDNARFYERTRRLNAALARENRERESAEAGLRTSERRLAGFLDGLPVGVIILDAQACPHFMNHIALQILDISDAARAARPLPALYRRGDAAPVSSDALPSSRALRGEYVWDDDLELRRDEASVPLTVWATPFRDPSGKVEYAIVAFQDVTEARRIEADRARLEEQVRQAQKTESIGRLAAGVAHDFNNLLVPILGYVGMAAQVVQDQVVVDYLARVRQAAEQAADLTRSLLASARQQVLNMEPLNLSEEVSGVQRILDSVIRENIELVQVLDPALPSIRADRSQLHQVLMNLVVNSCDAMPRGGQLVIGTKQVSVREVLWGTKEIPPGEYVVLTISDTGEGMDAATQARAFEPFFTTKESGRGTGLGLATVFGIVDQHQGAVQLHSAPGKGTTFEVWFPSIGAAPASVAPVAEAPSTGPTDRLLLVVEDDDGVRTFIEQALRQIGFQLIVARSPSEALELTWSAKLTPDALITDLVLPEMNGRELFAALREKLPRLRGLFISGYATSICSEGDALAPELLFLAKPFSLHQLRKCVDELLA